MITAIASLSSIYNVIFWHLVKENQLDIREDLNIEENFVVEAPPNIK